MTLPRLLTAQFSKDGSLIGTGGGGGLGLKNMGLLIDTATSEVVHDFQADKMVNSVSFANKEALVAFGDGAGQVHVFEKKATKAK